MKKGCLFSCFLFSVSITGFSQNVGIGTLTPTRAKLEVHGATGSTNAIFGGDASGISLQRTPSGIGFNEYLTNTAAKYIGNGYAAVQFQDPVTGFLSFLMFPNGSKDASVVFNRLGISIGVDGNVGVQADPLSSATLFATKANNVNGSAVFGGTSYNSHFDYDVSEDTYIRGGKSGSKVVINDIPAGRILLGSGSSRVSINNGIPTYPLEVRQRFGTGMKIYEPANNNNGWEMRMQHDAFYGPVDNLYFIYNGAYKCLLGCLDGTLYSFSDRRLKTNIRDISPLMEKFMQLEPVEYNMKAFSSFKKKTTGFIAQDVQKLFPELVAIAPGRHGYEGIDTLYGLNYDGFRMLTIRAMQEQQQKIKEMRQQNEMLEKRIAAAEALLKEDNR